MHRRRYRTVVGEIASAIAGHTDDADGAESIDPRAWDELPVVRRDTDRFANRLTVGEQACSGGFGQNRDRSARNGFLSGKRAAGDDRHVEEIEVTFRDVAIPDPNGR